MQLQPYLKIALAGVMVIGLEGAGHAQTIEVPPQLEGLSDAETSERLSFLQERLDAGQLTARTWQHGWTGIFGIGAVASAAQAIAADDWDGRVYNIVGAVKSAGATAQMVLDPLPARLGGEPMRAVPDGTRQGRLQRLAVGERLLVANAARADSRYSWRRHLEGVTTNLIGSAVIYAFGDSKDALVSALSGIAVGEAQIWSQPWRATGDLNDYRAAFPTTMASRGIEWQLRPTLNGAELAFRW
jgi:hypothetical protein